MNDLRALPRIWLRDPEALAIAALGFVGLIVLSAQLYEHIGGYEPCPLCLMQRVWYLLAGLATAAGLLHNPRWGIYPLLTALAAVIGGGFSIRQLWLQSLPPEEAPACGAGIGFLIENRPIDVILQAMTEGTGDCAKVDWTFLGLSFAGWALVGFLVIVGLAVLQLRAGNRPAT